MTDLTLYTFAMSHYSEKIRWVLDAEGLPYREVIMTPAFHMLPARRMGGRGQTTLPILQAGREHIQDSTRILEWLAANRAPLKTLPADAAACAEVMAVEERFDAIGKDVARFLYWTGFHHPQQIKALWTRHATPLQRAVIRLGYPLIKLGFKRKLRINARDVARAQQRIEAELDWLDARLAAGHRWLAGDAFTVADITAAALLAPIARPPQHPIYGEASFAATLPPVARAWQARPALQWVRRLYAEQRGAVQFKT